MSVSLIPAPAEYKENPRAIYDVSVLGKVKEYTGPRCSAAFRRKLAQLPDFAAAEAYELSIGSCGVKIQALTPEGVFRARQTLLKLAATDSARHSCTIFDYPRYRHRGLMIDESRSFKGKDFIKKQIDAMALLGLNSLHLHLTDAAGWRIEIKSHPELTERAAWRIGYTYAEWEARGYPFSTRDDPEAYGGFYTQEDLREIVAYASERYIQIIPEIEMPGHSMEVNRTYPDLACLDENGRRRSFSWDLCPGNDGTIRLLEDILTEVIDIFPCRYVHIGGDEAVMKDWPSCVNCRRRMQEEGFTDVHQLQGYLVSHIAEWLRDHGRTAVGWDEILETGITEDAVVMSWRGTAGGQKAAAAGHNVIMSPNTHVYFDYYQDLIRKEPLAVGELTSLHWVYTYDPGDDPHILGLQANLWCEKIPTVSHAEYMLYPRLFAIAEIGWTPASHHKDAEEFRHRARTLLNLFKSLGYNSFDMDTESDFARAGMRRTQAGDLIYPIF
ncbi:MAG: beta-N-acetylhexosaminidase [Bacteroidales bacterium]|nr:beta-N-acetylhexosaminidase [Bacteroidales bacterium]